MNKLLSKHKHSLTYKYISSPTTLLSPKTTLSWTITLKPWSAKLNIYIYKIKTNRRLNASMCQLGLINSSPERSLTIYWAKHYLALQDEQEEWYKRSIATEETQVRVSLWLIIYKTCRNGFKFPSCYSFTLMLTVISVNFNAK